MQLQKLLLMIAIYINCIYSINCKDYCYDKDPNKEQFTKHFATKSQYEFSKGSNSTINSKLIVPNCNPVKIWFLGRHGTRLPSARNMQELRELSRLRDEIIKNYENINSTSSNSRPLCDEDFEKLKHWHWNPNMTDDYAQHLTTDGWNELKNIAKYYQRIIPNVLENIYAKEKFLFRHVKDERSESSYKAFVEGLFGANAFEHIELQPAQDKDMLLKAYDECKTWNETNKRDDPTTEQSKFENSPLFQEAVRNVSYRLGFKMAIGADKIKTSWDMCRYDRVLNWRDAWCGAFTPTQVKMLEYLEDIGYYHKSGYAHEFNSNYACTTIVDMLKHLESKGNPKVIAYFAHSSTVLLLLNALGAAKDSENLRADNYLQMQSRKWRASELAPFASNLAAIKYDCPNDNERYKILFFLNQNPLDLTWCNDGLCNWSDVRRMYNSYRARDCAKTFCTETSSATSVAATSICSVVIIVILVDLLSVIFFSF